MLLTRCKPLCFRALLASTALAVTPQMAHAQAWDGQVDSDFGKAGNWNPDTAPITTSAVVVDTTTNAPVIDSGQSFTVTDITVGKDATAALTVRNGGQLTVVGAEGLGIGGSRLLGTGGIGTLNVIGTGSLVDTPIIYVAARTGSTGLLDISAGARVETDGLFAATASGSTATVRVRGAGSTLNIASTISAGGVGFGRADGLGAGRLLIEDGGVVQDTGAGSWLLDRGSSITISGSGSRLSVPTLTRLRGDMTISGGGTATLNAFDFGSTAVPTTLSITGTGSRLTTDGFVIRNDAAGPVTIQIAAGGEFFTDEGQMAIFGNSDVTVTGAGSLWRLAANSNARTEIGRTSGGEMNLNVLDDARMEVLHGFGMSIGQESSVRLSGANSVIDIGGQINIAAGNTGSPVGTFVVENGALLQTRGTSDNGLAFGLARTATIRNGGSWVMAGGLQLDMGQLVVDNGSLSAGGSIAVGTRFSGSRLTLLNADVNVRTISASLADSIISVGGVTGGAAGRAGNFNVGTLAIFSSAAMVFNHLEANLLVPSDLQGNGTVRFLAGHTNLVGNAQRSSVFDGGLIVTGGKLSLNHTIGGASGTISVSNGAILAGAGLFGGNVTIADGTFAPGNSAGNFRIGQSLTLGSASILNFELGSPTGTAGVASDLITVARNLTLDGTLNVTNVGGFGGGLYRLINYGGTLTNNGLDIGLTPAGFAAGDLTVQTATAGQVNLLVAAAAPTSFTFWDGAGTGADNIISGGTGTWDATRTNWTVSDGKFNGAYDRAGMLIFGAEAQSGGVLTTIGGPRAAAAPLLDRRFTVTVDAGQGAIAIANGATLSGTAGMQFAANGYLLTGADLVLGGFTTVRVGDGTTAGAGFIAEIANNITGAGLLWKDDLGTLILSGTNSHTGGTRVRKGTLMGDTDSLQGRVDDDGALIINQVQNGRFAGQLFGEGTLAKEGAGTLTYDVTDVAETFEGPITINAGRFIIGGNTLGGSVTVNNTATLGGTARGLGSLFVRSGGTLAPGNSIGQLTVSSATFDAGSIFQVELNDGGSVPGVNNDLLLVDGGDVRINGGTVHVSPANGTDTGATYASGTRYRIISTDDGGEVTGTFDTLTDDFAFLNFTLSYGNEDVFLTSALAKTTFCLGGMTFNQCSTGEGAFSIGSGAVFDALLNLTDAEAPVALDALSGEVHASARTMLLEDSRFPREAVLARLGSADSGAGAWGHAFGSRGHWDSDGNAGRADRDIDGFFTGIDAPLGQNARAGLMGGYTHTKVEIGSRGSTGSVDSWHLGAYGGGQWGGLGVRLGGAVAWHNLATTRAIAFRGFADAATDSYDARTGQLFAEAAYRVEVRDLVLEPFAQVAWVNLTSSDYAEQGGAAALSGGNDSLDVSFSTIGLRGETVLGGKLRLTGSGAWRHAFSALAERTPFTTHAFAGSDDFTIAGLPVARNALAVDAGLVLDLSDNARLSATYSGQAGSSLSDHGGKVGLSIRF